ncbi:hypothetical protein BS50DRAFT_638483 [Corynespora cassiicola Philippines]|uniref:Uncharacterized protein n=1 Tax=Corynespora cassiicola Philippines TaxID=1448308 RepID=A0A2T2NBR6_CORCC|nr:hypothetical protein BS50DRAFT_638483 [Corynespora cassiicola Philippines]
MRPSVIRQLMASNDISERSKRFWIGTIKWDDNGVWGDDGVYRRWSLEDPQAWPPTPMPFIDPDSDLGDIDDAIDLSEPKGDISHTAGVGANEGEDEISASKSSFKSTSPAPIENGIYGDVTSNLDFKTDEAEGIKSASTGSLSGYPSDISDMEPTIDPGPRKLALAGDTNALRQKLPLRSRTATPASVEYKTASTSGDSEYRSFNLHEDDSASDWGETETTKTQNKKKVQLKKGAKRSGGELVQPQPKKPKGRGGSGTSKKQMPTRQSTRSTRARL